VILLSRIKFKLNADLTTVMIKDNKEYIFSNVVMKLKLPVDGEFDLAMNNLSEDIKLLLDVLQVIYFKTGHLKFKKFLQEVLPNAKM